MPTIAPDQFSIGEGFRQRIAEQSLTPKSDETYLTPDLSICLTDKGPLYYARKTNEVLGPFRRGVVAPPTQPTNAAPDPWDDVELIHAGFSTPAEWLAEFGVRRAIRAAVWHSMEGFYAGAIARWNTGAAGAHLSVLKSGRVKLNVLPENVAWGAGTHNRPGQDGYGRTPFWRATNINPFALHTEIEGFADARDGGFTLPQQAAIRKIAGWLTVRHGVLREHTFDAIDGHHLHSELSSTRGDPGPSFNWAWVL